MNLEYLELFRVPLQPIYSQQDFTQLLHIFKESAQTLLPPQIFNIVWLMQELIDLTAMTLTFI